MLHIFIAYYVELKYRLQVPLDGYVDYSEKVAGLVSSTNAVCMKKGGNCPPDLLYSAPNAQFNHLLQVCDCNSPGLPFDRTNACITVET